MQYRPYAYQDFACNHILDNPYAGLFLEMGLGKTVVTLTAIKELIYERFEASKVLVVAPLRVARDTWPAEVQKWDHLKRLKLSLVIGSEKERKAALRKPADIYIINRENVNWLVGYYGRGFPFDLVVLDELSSFKSAKAQRFKSLRQIRPYVPRVIGLTGTPAPNSLVDLWPQLYLLDQGERLEKTITAYRTKYFKPGRTNGMVVFDYKLLEGSKDQIYKKISDICISMQTKDYLELPDRLDRRVDVQLDPAEFAKYQDFEMQAVMAMPQGEIVTAVNAAALTNKLLQYANGAIYDEHKLIHKLHDAKIRALEEIVDTANGEPVLVYYWYKHDLYRIQEALKAYKPVQLQTSEDVQRWNQGKIPLMLAHPASAGHGLNLQAGGHIIVWFGLTWSLELYQQANARLHRQGQSEVVIVHHLVAKGTMDEDVMMAIENKADGQEALMQAVKARVDKYALGGVSNDQRRFA